MAVLWFGPFYVVVMWTVVSSFMGSTWSDRNNYDDYLDNAEITTGQGMKGQELLRQGNTRLQEPYDEDERYIYDRAPKEVRNRNSDVDILLTDFWDSQTPEGSIFKSDTSSDSGLNQESWFNPNLEIFGNSVAGTKMQQKPDADDPDGNGLVSLGSVSLKKNLGEKRQSHSLSIVNPLDVLRQRLMLDMARRRMQVNQDQIKANDKILANIGKRKKRTLIERVKANDEKLTMRKRRQNEDYFDWPQNSAANSLEV